MSSTKEAEVNYQIEQARKQFYNVLMAKKRSVRRKYLEMGSITKEHQLSTLPYRAMLQNAENFLDECNLEDETENCSDQAQGILDSDNSLSSPLSELTSESFNLDETDYEDKTEHDDLDDNHQKDGAHRDAEDDLEDKSEDAADITSRSLIEESGLISTDEFVSTKKRRSIIKDINY